MFWWLKRRAIEKVERPATAEFRFDRVEPVGPHSQYGTTGPGGWGFTIWGAPDGEDFMYRHLLERLAQLDPDARLSLPEWYEGEDLIEGELIWRGHHVWVWYETVLTHTWLWSADRATAESLRDALVPLALNGLVGDRDE
jgi:hypothetical protein